MNYNKDYNKQMNNKNSLLYALEWPAYQRHGKVKNYQNLLKTKPNNIFQLSFWSELLMISKIQQLDIPENAVFYLFDQTYNSIFDSMSISETAISKIKFKISLTTYIFKLQTNQTLVRNIEQAIISSCAMYPHSQNSLSNQQMQKMKQSGIFQFLNLKCQFLNKQSSTKISSYLKQRIHPSKQIKQIGDVTLGTFVVQQIDSASNKKIDLGTSSILTELRKYLIAAKKQKIVPTLREYVVKSKNVYALNLLIALAQQFKRINEILKLYSQFPQLFYSLYWQVKDKNIQSQYPHLCMFMLNYGSVKIILLHQLIYYSYRTANYVVDKSEYSSSAINQYLNQKDFSIFKYFRYNPEHIARECLRIYLRWSNFNISEKNVKKTYVDPLSYIGVIRKFWQDQFHSKVLNYCLWITMDQLYKNFCIIGCNNSRTTSSIGLNSMTEILNQSVNMSEFKTYMTNTFLFLFHILIGYKIGTFVNYYPIQQNELQYLMTLETVPYLLLNCPQAKAIVWLSFYYNNQLSRIARSQNGYDLLLNFIQLKLGSVDPKILNMIQHDLMQKNIKFWLKNKNCVLKILDFFCDVKAYSQNADRIKKIVQRIGAI